MHTNTQKLTHVRLLMCRHEIQSAATIYLNVFVELENRELKTELIPTFLNAWKMCRVQPKDQ